MRYLFLLLLVLSFVQIPAEAQSVRLKTPEVFARKELGRVTRKTKFTKATTCRYLHRYRMYLRPALSQKYYWAKKMRK